MSPGCAGFLRLLHRPGREELQTACFGGGGIAAEGAHMRKPAEVEGA